MEQSNIAEVSSQPVLDDASSASTVQSPVEKMLPQSHVDNIIKGVKQKYDAKIAELNNSNLNTQQSFNPTGSVNLDAHRNMVSEEVKKHIEQLYKANSENLAMQEAERIANEFRGKLQEAKSKYDDFDEVTGVVPFASIPHIVSMANTMDNTADVMYELSKNPSKLASLNELVRLNPQNPEFARREMRKLSESIKLNEQAKQVKTANEPLSRIQPSPVGADSGSMDVPDFQKMFRRRR